MKSEDRYDSLVIFYWELACLRYHVKTGLETAPSWLLVKAQIHQESNFDPGAESSCGALGLLQLMPLTDLELDGVRNARDPEACIHEGTDYLAKQWGIFRAEKGLERWKFALGAYNAGSGNIIKAQAMAESRGLDPSRWVSIANVLHEVTGEKNATQTLTYVANIMSEFFRTVKVE